MPPVIQVKQKPTALGVHIFAGGFTVGVKAAGFDVLGHLEDTEYGVATARANWPALDVRVGRTNWREEEFASRIDLLYANPPCAIFSVCGVSTTRGADAWRTDSRLGCWHRAFEVFAAVRPRVFALESVCQAYTKGREVVDQFTRDALVLGYSVQHVLEDAQWMGVPQSRKRFFFVAHDPKLDLKFKVDFGDTVTVAEALAGINDSPADWRKARRFDEIHLRCMQIMKGGDRLKDAYDRLFPSPEINCRGQAVGRPGFMVHRLRPDVPMGVFVGDICIHPNQHRHLNDAEMRAICTYPQNFKLAGSPDGWGSQLARAVMPNVGRWLATAVRESLGGILSNANSRVLLVDLRRPPGTIEDISSRYEGSAVFTVKPFVKNRSTNYSAVTLTKLPTKPQLTSLSSGDYRPNSGEGSGEFIRRLWVNGLNDPNVLVALVHQNWPGRKTRVGDVYYNYRKLLEEGNDVPPWPGGRRIKELKSVPAASVQKSVVSNLSKPGRKLLLTGSTPIQVGSDRTVLKIITAAACWRSALKEMGYDVDWRSVTPGEDLSAYDRVCVVLNQPCSISSSHVYGALWALRERPDATVFLDDWQTGQLVSGFQTCARSKDRAFRLTKYWPAEKMAAVKDNEGPLFEIVQKLAAGNWRWPVVVPTLGDGDVLLLGIPAETVVGVDPTPFSKRYDRIAAIKNRRWIQATLTNKPLPCLGWDVVGYGMLDRSKGVGGIGSAGDLAQRRLPENELMGEYCKSWGVLSPAHPHAGSGWWRMRYLMAADAGCILSADVREAECLGDGYVAASDPAKVEAMSNRQLIDLAVAQVNRLKKISWSAEKTSKVLKYILNR